MKLAISHVLRSQAKGQARAFLLIEWLNETPNQGALARVVEIIETLREINRFRAKDLPRVRLGPWSKLRSTKAQSENLARLGILSNRSVALLKRYTFSPRHQRNTGEKWTVVWKSSVREGGVDIVLSAEGDTIYVTEGDAVLRLLRLIEDGYFARIRKCGFCPKWFFAGFEHQQYCGKTCQMRAYKTTPEWKAKRRKYMQKYRVLKASGKVR